MPDYTIFEDAPLTEPPVRLNTGLLRSGSNQPLDLITTNITLDLYTHDGQKTLVKAIALDSKTRYVAAALQDNGDIYDLPSDATVTLYVIRPDGAGVEIAGTTYAYEGDGGSQIYGAYAELTQTALALKGSAVGQFKITVGEQILRTKTFSISIGQALDDTNEWAGEYQGYNLDELVSDLTVNYTIPIDQWAQGSIAQSTGSNTNSSTRCRSAGYFNQSTLGYGTIKIQIADGFKLNARIWDEQLNYVSGYPSDWVTSVLELPVRTGYSYRFVIARANDAALNPMDIPEDAITIVNDSYTDATLSLEGKSADAAAVKQLVKPYTATVNACTSSIIAAKAFTYNDGSLPVVDWYLLADYAGDLFISKDLKHKVRIARFVNWVQYKFAVRQNGDIIAVFRNEFSSTGSSYDSSLDTVRQNPFVCLYAEGYSEWHEVDFGSSRKPCGWLENCGVTSLPNGDIIFGEYTRMMVVYTANVWRIKETADITNPASWEIIKSFRVAENDTAEYDDTVIEHIHTVQVDPYTGTVYLATGDKGLKSQMWYSTDGGDTWVRQEFVDPDTSQTVTSGEKLFRLLNYNFAEEYVYWSSDSYSQHAVLRCERNGINGFTPNSIRILAEIAPTTGQAATYGTVLYPQYKIMVLMERLDSSASSMLFRALDLTTNTLKTLCTIKSVGGASVHLGFRTEYTEFEPEDGIIKVGFSGNANYRNYNAICGNSASNSFEKNINSLSIRINVDADRNVYARFGAYYI